MKNSVAENVLGTMGTICWTGQLIPQVWKSYRDKQTAGLSPWLMLIWGVSSAFLGVYTILQHFNIPLQVQPQLFGFLTLVSWGQCLYYDPKRQDKKRLTFLMVVGTMIVVGALEAMLVLVSRPAYERGISAPVKLFGVLSAVLIGLGLLPQYWEIYVRREVTGVSYTFILIDMLGGLLNNLSLVFSREFDVLAAASYTLVIVMDSVIIFAALYLNPRACKRRRLAEAAGVTGIDHDNEPQPSLQSTTSVHVDSSKQHRPDDIDIEAKAGLDDEEKSIEGDVETPDKGSDVIAEENETQIPDLPRIRGIPMLQVDSVGKPPSTEYVPGTLAVAGDDHDVESELGRSESRADVGVVAVHPSGEAQKDKESRVRMIRRM